MENQSGGTSTMHLLQYHLPAPGTVPGIPKACGSAPNLPQKVAEMMAGIVELASELRRSLSCG